MVGNVGVAYGAEQDGVETGQLRQAVLGHQVAGFTVEVAAPRELREPEGEAPGRCQRLQRLAALRDDLRPDAVSGDYCQVVLSHF